MSQVGEGWRLVKTAYDDGGLSGGTMERPALQRLLDDISHGLIDVVVVYKVDRLTRALADFAKMVELFDAHSVSFVAVTQQFNTTTSMGRLTLNVLLSFAQFEREVTAERIRDKIAASKRKGLWMGGVVPLGYEVRDRRVVTDEREVETVRHIFRRYLELGCVRLHKEDLDRRRFFPSGELPGAMSRPVGARSPAERFTRSSRIRSTSVRSGTGTSAIPVSIRRSWTARCGTGPSSSFKSTAFVSSVTRQAAKRVPSSGVSRRAWRWADAQSRPQRRAKVPLQRLAHLPGRSDTPMPRGWRLPAQELEDRVAAAIGQMLGDESALLEAAQRTDINSSQVDRVLHAARSWRQRLQAEAERTSEIAALVERVELQSDGITVSIRLPITDAEKSQARLSDPIPIARSFPMQLKRRGVELQLIVGDHHRSAAIVDLSLLKAVARAHRWFDELSTGKARSLAAIAASEGLAVRYVGRLIRLAFLAPEIVESIVERSAADHAHRGSTHPTHRASARRVLSENVPRKHSNKKPFLVLSQRSAGEPSPGLRSAGARR
jgi:DNA invertase Pin-like site-specific DNA recombinase